jgi:hypothetical protein
MKYGVLAAVLMLFAVSAKAATWNTYVFPGGEGVLSISDQPCTVPNVIEEWERIRFVTFARTSITIDEPKQSRLLWNGVVYAGCYVVDPGNNHVYNIDSTGDKLFPPILHELFVPHEGALPVEPGVKI